MSITTTHNVLVTTCVALLFLLCLGLVLWWILWKVNYQQCIDSVSPLFDGNKSAAACFIQNIYANQDLSYSCKQKICSFFINEKPMAFDENVRQQISCSIEELQIIFRLYVNCLFAHQRSN